jgi:hypothetical protein
VHRSKEPRYSITSSARPSNGSGTVIPSALADIDAKKPRLELLERYCIAGRRPGRDLADDVLAPSRYDVLPKVSGVAVVARCYGLSAVRFDPCARSFSIVCS